jgi:hypothetical protein
MDNPRINVNTAQTTTMYPCNFNHPRVIGMTIAGTETKNVTKIRTAFPIAATSVLKPFSIFIKLLDLTDLTRGIASIVDFEPQS